MKANNRALSLTACRAILAVTAILAPGAMAHAQSACARSDFPVQAQALMDAVTKSNQFSGSVLVARQGKPIFRQGFGLADQEWGVANTPDTKFRIGSNTKQFTATAILQLAEQGKLSLDDPVSKFYPDAPPSWSKITIKHLLTHTSGIPSYTDIPKFFEGDARLPHTPGDIVKLTRDEPLQFEPGSKFAYDNSGYVLLGYIVEKASGQPYADYLQTHIFTPLGMTSSGYDSSQAITPHRASGYAQGPKGWINASFLDMSVPYAAGSLYSTVDDLLIWDQALYQAKPLKAASLQAMFTDYGFGYGYGWFIDKQFSKDRISHSGGIQGFTSEFDRYPKDGLTVAVLANFEGAQSPALALELGGLCLGDEATRAAFQRFQSQTATPGTDTALKQVIGGLKSGQPAYDQMTASVADVTRKQLTVLQARMTELGDVVSIRFKGVGPEGADIYEVGFTKGKLEWRLSLTSDGKLATISLRPAP